MQLPLGILEHMRSRRATSRRGWSRFVSVRLTRQQAAGMQPVLPPETLAVIDRHYNSPVAYQPPQPSVFAVRVGNTLQFRLAEYIALPGGGRGLEPPFGLDSAAVGGLGTE